MELLKTLTMVRAADEIVTNQRGNPNYSYDTYLRDLVNLLPILPVSAFCQRQIIKEAKLQRPITNRVNRIIEVTSMFRYLTPDRIDPKIVPVILFREEINYFFSMKRLLQAAAADKNFYVPWEMWQNELLTRKLLLN